MNAAPGPKLREGPKSGFQVLQWRWIIERTFGWLNRSRRLSKDFEALSETTETSIQKLAA
jgi:putative transposase